MRWISDPTRRFGRRPHYDLEEIEDICQELVSRAFAKRKQSVEYPLSTSMLSKLLEDSAQCDFGRDLSLFGDDVEALTQFAFEKQPQVYISEKLRSPNLERRRRMTMAHELGHVHLHNVLYQAEAGLRLFTDMERKGPTYCKRSTIIRGGDWMEWQASYAAGAFLTPFVELKKSVDHFVEEQDVKIPLSYESASSAQLTTHIASKFQVSAEAARVRLVQRDIISPRSVQSLNLSN